MSLSFPRLFEMMPEHRLEAVLLWPACQILGHPTTPVVMTQHGPGHPPEGDLTNTVGDQCHCGAVLRIRGLIGDSP